MSNFGILFFIAVGYWFQSIAFTQAKLLGCGCKSFGALAPPLLAPPLLAPPLLAPPPFAGDFGCGFPAPPPPPVAFAPFPQPVPVRIPPPPSVTIPNIIMALLPPQRPCPRPALPFLPPPPPTVMPLPQPYPVPIADPGFGCGCR